MKSSLRKSRASGSTMALVARIVARSWHPGLPVRDFRRRRPRQSQSRPEAVGGGW